MSTKINIDTDFYDNPKIRQLRIYCGDESPFWLIRLWCYAAKYYPKDGVFLNMERSSIETISGFTGTPGNFIGALERLKLIEKVGEVFKIHDWKEHAGFLWTYKVNGRAAGKKSGESRRLKSKTNRTNLERNANEPRTIELNRIELNRIKDTTLSPNGDGVKALPLETKDPKKENELQKIIKGWKMLNDLPTEGEESKLWDKVHFPRYAKSAKSLLSLFGYEGAVNCMEYVFLDMQKKKLTCTIETVVKHSDSFREQLARRGQ